MGNSNSKNVKIDYNVKEIIDNLNKSLKLTQEDKKRIENSLDFNSAIEAIDVSGNGNRVIFTDGEEQLIYEDGEFFIVSSTEGFATRKKKKREEARNMYIEYFIKYQLNPIIKEKNLEQIAKTIAKENIERETENKYKKVDQKKKVKEDLSSKVKSDIKLDMEYNKVPKKDENQKIR